jgi:hypothetical protein
MTPPTLIQPGQTAASEAAWTREDFLAQEKRPLLLADWQRVLFIHFELDPRDLRRHVPFELDLIEGRAWISLVAFTMARLRPFSGGRFGAWAFRPLAAEHSFLNVRTYVKHGGESGIYFLHEFLSRRLNVVLGPVLFGLPYHFGRLQYHHDQEPGRLHGRAERGKAAWAYQAMFPPAAGFRTCPENSLCAFLLERYAAFTRWGPWRRRFRIWHPPWRQTEVEFQCLEDSLLRRTFDWYARARQSGAHYSPGLNDVWLGRPRWIARK